MERALVVTVRFHEGRYHGAGGWPPAPARLFQALMAGAAKGATLSHMTLDALDWLERLPPPVIAAPRGRPGQRYSSFVPNNDIDAQLSKGISDIDKAVASIRDGKDIHPFLFEVEAPVIYCWPIDDDGARATTLCEAARGLYQLGRGVDMAWAEAAVMDAEEAEKRLSRHGGIVYRPSAGGGSGRSLLCPRPGTVRSLTDRFEGMRHRFRKSGSNRKPTRIFVQPPKPLLANVTYDARPERIIFELREPDAKSAFASRRLREVAALVTEARDRAARRLCDAEASLGAEVDRYLIGQGAENADKQARVRIVPIPSIGHPHADMMIRRLAVYVPQSCPLSAADLSWAFAQVAWVDGDGVITSELRNADDDRMTGRYEQRRRHWLSVTPLALSSARRRRIDPSRQVDEAKDGSERAHEEARAARTVRQALRHAGVTAAPADIHVQREPFDAHGERAESFAAGTRFPKEALWHVSISFAEPVAGPLLLGDGRYLGLGLMGPRKSTSGVLAFGIEGGLTDSADFRLVARATRRAMMARVQGSLPGDSQIPSYVSGHEEDGAPARDGTHRHIAVAADLPRRRLLFIAPNRMQRGGVRWSDVRRKHGLVERALEGMETLLAGKAGRLTLAPAAFDVESDPLFARARVWESVTDYSVTRHRRLPNEEALRADVLEELRRCGWPIPKRIEVLATLRGPRGGLAGRLRITFAVAQKGPLLLGRTAHKGGGLFAGST